MASSKIRIPFQFFCSTKVASENKKAVSKTNDKMIKKLLPTTPKWKLSYSQRDITTPVITVISPIKKKKNSKKLIAKSLDKPNSIKCRCGGSYSDKKYVGKYENAAKLNHEKTKKHMDWELKCKALGVPT